MLIKFTEVIFADGAESIAKLCEEYIRYADISGNDKDLVFKLISDLSETILHNYNQEDSYSNGFENAKEESRLELNIILMTILSMVDKPGLKQYIKDRIEKL